MNDVLVYFMCIKYFVGLFNTICNIRCVLSEIYNFDVLHLIYFEDCNLCEINYV